MEVGCNNFNTILVGNHLVNTYGLDTLETGSMIAWAMELYEKGILTDKDTDGLKLEWGNDEAVIEMIHRIAERKGLGDILGRVVARNKKRGWNVDENVRRKWAQVAGPEIAARTSVVSFRRKMLRIRVDSSALLAELDGVYRKHLLISLAEGDDPVYVRNLSFELSGAAGGK